MNKRPEIIITFADLFWGILKYWRILVVFTLVGALALGAYGYVKSDTGLSSETKQLANLAGLSDVDIEAITNAVDLNCLYSNMLSDYDSNYITKIDENKILLTTLSYYVDASVGDNYDYTADLLQAYAIHGIGADLRSAFLAKDEASAIREEDLGYLLSAATEGRTVTFTIRTGAEDSSKQAADTLIELIREGVQNASKNLKTEIGNHTLKEISVTATIGPDSVITDAKLVKKTAVETVQEDAEDAYEHLTDGQRARVDAVLAVKRASSSVSATRTISKKKVVFGAIFGLVLGVLIALACYVWSKKIVNIAELEQGYGLHVFGKVLLPAKHNNPFAKLDRAIACAAYRVSGKVSETEQIDRVLKRISCRTKEESFAKLLLVGTTMIPAELSDKAIEWMPEVCTVCAKPTCAEEALLEMHDGGKVVLVEHIGVSKRAAVEDLLKMCEEQNITVLGMVTLL